MDDAIFNQNKKEIMKNKYNSTDLMMFVVMAIPAIYLAFSYSSLPTDIPIHFNLHGANEYGEKSMSWLFIFIMLFVSFSLYSYLKNIPSIDPKRTVESSTSMIKKISILVVTFISIFQVITINAMKGNVFSILTFLLPTASIFFCLIGNLMNNFQPNYFVGILLPWALRDKTNWRETHRFGGKIWFVVGIIMAIATLLLPLDEGFNVFIIGVLIMILAPIIYSFYYFKKNK